MCSLFFVLLFFFVGCLSWFCFFGRKKKKKKRPSQTDGRRFAPLRPSESEPLDDPPGAKKAPGPRGVVSQRLRPGQVRRFSSGGNDWQNTKKKRQNLEKIRKKLVLPRLYGGFILEMIIES